MKRLLRSWLWGLALSLAIGLAIGTCARRQAERPVRYIGWQDVEDAPPVGKEADSAGSADAQRAPGRLSLPGGERSSPG